MELAILNENIIATLDDTDLKLLNRLKEVEFNRNLSHKKYMSTIKKCKYRLFAWDGKGNKFDKHFTDEKKCHLLFKLMMKSFELQGAVIQYFENGVLYLDEKPTWRKHLTVINKQ